jgi:hypothetical protein
MKKLLWLAAPFVLAVGVMTGGTAAFAASVSPVAPPGQGVCSHGNTGKVCKPDPSTSGRDCDSHGNNGVGGVNEDHCLRTTITTHTTTSQTTSGTTKAPTEVPVDHSSTSSQTTTTGTAGAITGAESSNGNSSALAASGTKPLAASVTKPLAASIAKPRAQSAVAKEGGGLLGHKASGLLPFTGLPIWIVVLVGSATLTAGWAIRRLAA